MRLVLTGYCRTESDEICLVSLRTGGCVCLVDDNHIVRDLLRGYDTLDVARRVALSCHDVDESVVIRDITSICHELILCGVCREIDGRGGLVDVQPSLSSQKRSNQREEHVSVFGDYFKRHALLSDLHVDLTDACTERCVHCYVPQGQRDYLPYEICAKVLREFREQQGLTVQLTGGECMMHPDFEKICRLCRELDLNFIVMSNLTLCDEKVVVLLKETDPQFVNVSLYSMDENEHDAVTQIPGSWRRTRAAIDALQAAGVAVRLATPLLKSNQKAYPALKAFAKERRVHLVPDCDILPRCGGDCSNLNYTCTPEEVEMVLAGDKAFWDRGYGKNPNIKPEDKVCDIGKLLSINSKGFYYPCSGMHEYVLGDARQVTLTEVWQGEMMNYLRGLKNSDFLQCAACEHRTFCKVCPAFNFNATGSLFKTIPAKCAVSAAKHRVYGEV